MFSLQPLTMQPMPEFESEFNIIVHGGAGPMREDYVDENLVGCREAALAGWRVLKEGGAALDAVVTAVIQLENNPNFNAGTGATLNADGQARLDASIMDGEGLRAGAVAAVERVRNPIQLAREVLKDGRHVMLVADGAQRFALGQGIPAIRPEELIIERQRRRWEHKHGTVGCVARDLKGRFAAGTSTGGQLGALPGRVGDSPQIGSGTYANKVGGVSCTGIGEDIIRVVMAKRAVDLLGAGYDAAKAAAKVLEEFERRTASEAGLIIIDQQGHVGFARNPSHMPVAWASGDGETHTAI
jgi:L-asparaginase / beta-aspartyl-peptidase